MALNKSEYMRGRICHKRIEYGRRNFPTVSDADLLSKEQAEVGQIIHHIAQLQFPDAYVNVPIRDLILNRPAVGIEVDMQAADYEARADVLMMSDEEIRLIEVKSKVHPTSDNGELLSVLTDKGTVRGHFTEMVEDVTFQSLVLLEVLSRMGHDLDNTFPPLRYELMLLNPAFVTGNSTLRQRFSINSSGVVSHSKPLDHDELNNMFIRVDITEAVSVMTSEVNSKRLDIYTKVLAQSDGTRSSACKSCEYRVPYNDGKPNGFAQCWGGVFNMTTSVLDVPYVSSIKINEVDAVEELVRNGKFYPSDLQQEQLLPTKNNIQRRFIDAYVSRKESCEAELKHRLSECKAPYVFIDVEAFNGALSLWKGGRAYEVAAFQWSCHVLDEQGAIHHSQWMHEGREHPASAFLSSLYHAVKDAGTVNIWSPYEKTAVKHALQTAQRLGQHLESDVVDWAQHFVTQDNPLVVDMLELARNYYVHPDAKGSSSIKDVLKAIWKEHHTSFFPDFERYFKKEDGYVFSPYNTLPMNYGHHRLASVTDGAAAMIAYYECMFGRTDYATREKLQDALFAYCELDTAAMVIIFQHWMKQ